MSTVNILRMNKKATPIESDELCAKSAVDLVTLIKKREISCVDLMESCIQRYEKVNFQNYYLEKPFEESCLALYNWSPIADELKILDKKIVLNSMKLKWNLTNCIWNGIVFHQLSS